MKKNLLTKLMTPGRRRDLPAQLPRGRGGRAARPVDLDGVARVEEAIREGWLLHFPAGTTRKGAPLRSGVSRLLHNTKAVALPLRVDGFRDLLLHKQVPGKLFKRCSLKIHPPLDLDAFYAKPYHQEDGARLLRHLEDTIGDRDSNTALAAVVLRLQGHVGAGSGTAARAGPSRSRRWGGRAGRRRSTLRGVVEAGGEDRHPRRHRDPVEAGLPLVRAPARSLGRDDEGHALGLPHDPRASPRRSRPRPCGPPAPRPASA